MTAPAKRKSAAEQRADTARIKAAQDRAARKERARKAGNERVARLQSAQEAAQQPLPINPLTGAVKSSSADTAPDAPRASRAAQNARAKTNAHAATEQLAAFDLGSAIKQLTPEFVACRDFGHSWRPHFARWIAVDNCFEETLRCARCGTERVRFLGARGQLLQNRYEYPEGYQMRGSGYLSTSDRDQIRLASIQTIMERPS